MEDMLKACAIDFKGSWDDHLALAEFAYNNSYHASIGMAPLMPYTVRDADLPLVEKKWVIGSCSHPN